MSFLAQIAIQSLGIIGLYQLTTHILFSQQSAQSRYLSLVCPATSLLADLSGEDDDIISRYVFSDQLSATWDSIF